MDTRLAGKVALVAGATRGAGRGIAVELGAAGATVYCTGRSSRADAAGRSLAKGGPFDLEGRPETIEETAELVQAQGGVGIAAKVDHTDPAQVEALLARIDREKGHLDILVNDIWGGDALTEWGKSFWELDLGKGFKMLERAVESHIITSRFAAPLMVNHRRGLIVEVTDGDSLAYRDNLFYDLAKTTVIRLAFAASEELRKHGIAALALTPGFLRSEAMLEHFGVSEKNWHEASKKDANFIASESPHYIGRAIVALATDPAIMTKSGGAFSTWGLQREYGFVDLDGTRPSWGNHAKSEDFGRQQARSNARYLAPFMP